MQFSLAKIFALLLLALFLSFSAGAQQDAAAAPTAPATETAATPASGSWEIWAGWGGGLYTAVRSITYNGRSYGYSYSEGIGYYMGFRPPAFALSTPSILFRSPGGFQAQVFVPYIRRGVSGETKYMDATLKAYFSVRFTKSTARIQPYAGLGLNWSGSRTKGDSYENGGSTLFGMEPIVGHVHPAGVSLANQPGSARYIGP